MEKDCRIVVIVKCIGCGEKKEIHPYEIPEKETPICLKCGMPMIAQEARSNEQ